ncbi:MAG: hypothetical protein LBJ22_05020 [Synergistaceae bacterium]|jgi:glycosyltransferase involved in cell wall biosynthesis|nr:hypothetical protein [Synergistaceae bacterium]
MDCIWYVSSFRRPWEAAVIGSLAAALKAGGVKAPQVYVEGGTANFRIDGILSWNSLTFFERAAIVLFKGNLWHLWGDAPLWWRWIRLRARTVHTLLDTRPRWKGHPTRFFPEQAHEGESLIVPTFDSKVAWAKDGDDLQGSTLLLAAPPDKNLSEALAGSEVRGLALDAAETETSLKRGAALFTDDHPSNVLLAAYLTMQGVPVMAYDAPLLKSVLGLGGYVAVPRDDDKTSWPKAVCDVMSETGRAASASARRFLKKNYSAPDAVKSLENLYQSVTNPSGAKGKS